MPLYSVYSDSYIVPDVVINEIMWAKAEYVELQNTTDFDISLNGWTCTRQKTAADTEDVEITFGIGDAIPAHGFFLVETSEDTTTMPSNKIKSVLGLVDTGALLRLKNQDGVIIDSANHYGSWLGGENSATGISMERIIPVLLGDDVGSWQTSTGSIGGRAGTPGQQNSVILSSPTPTPTPTPVPSPMPSPEYSNQVYLNEFIPNPVGDDSNLEFIELYNNSDDVVDVSGWKLDDVVDGGSSPFIIPDGTTIDGGGFLVFYSNQTKLSLNNDSDYVRLLHPDGVVVHDEAYNSSVEGYSYDRIDDGDFQQSSRPTPGEANSIELPTPTPTPTPKATATPKPVSTSIAYDFSSKIVINEVYPNPVKGDKNNEFIEIKNLDNRSISLAGWTLDDEDGGSRPYHFKSGDVIGAKKVISLDKNTTKIALNNSDDSARLVDPHGKVVAILLYQKTHSGQSLSRTDDGSYQWTISLTPSQENIISVQKIASPSPKVEKPRKPIVQRARVAGSSSISEHASPLSPWPSIGSREVVRTVYGDADIPNPSKQKQVLFMFLGALCAGGQLVSGISQKERIWFG